MLRVGFLPSDFNPMLLMLGEIEDLRALAGVLRRFARDPSDLRLDMLAFCAGGDTEILLTASPGAPGVSAMPEAAGCYVWRVTPELAAGFAGMVEALAEPGRLAGSEMLECGLEEEIPVKVSRGEYTDDFLLHAR